MALKEEGLSAPLPYRIQRKCQLLAGIETYGKKYTYLTFIYTTN